MSRSEIIESQRKKGEIVQYSLSRYRRANGMVNPVYSFGRFSSLHQRYERRGFVAALYVCPLQRSNVGVEPKGSATQDVRDQKLEYVGLKEWLIETVGACCPFYSQGEKE